MVTATPFPQSLHIVAAIRHGIHALLLTATGTQHCHGQSDTSSVNADERLFINPHEYPSFPGGEMEMFCFIDRTIDKDLLRSVDTTGTAYVQFTVDTTGQITNVRIIKSLTETVDNELVRIIGLMPKWTPGKFLGRVEETMWNLPLRIPLRENEHCH